MSNKPDLFHQKDKPFVILDGSMGTMLQKRGMKPGTIPELLNITDPDLVQSVHRDYARAGSDIVYANTFGANPDKLAGTGYSLEDVIQAAIRNVRIAAPDCLCALDIGPLGQLLEPLGTLSFEEAYERFAAVVKAGKNADLIVIETMADLYETKAALLAAKEHSDLPVLVSMTFQEDGRTFTGTTPEIFARTMTGLGADCLGINCSAGPDTLVPLLKEVLANTHLPVAAKPNAGLPDPRDGSYSLADADFVKGILPALEAGVTVVGGCCGTTPDTIRALSAVIGQGIDVSRIPYEEKSFVCSALQGVTVDGVRPIGERLNPTGKKRFQQALKDRDFGYLVSQALEQVEAGAAILDLNVGAPGIDEVTLLPEAVKRIQSVVDVPLQLDSSNPRALEAALRVYNGKPSVNSVSAEAEKLAAVLPLVKRYGAAVVGLALDEEGIPQSAQKRLENAQKILDACRDMGISEKDVWIDCLSLTVSAQQEQAMETLNAIRVLGERGIQTTLGVSNISFGLPDRPLLTSTFLTMAMTAGLRLPIVNVNSAPIRNALDAFLVLSGQDENAEHFIAASPHETGQAVSKEKTPEAADLTDGSPLSQAIRKGLKETAAELARDYLQTHDSLELTERELIPALDKVGKDYEAQRIFLPQLLQAAGAAQAVFAKIKAKNAGLGQEAGSGHKIVMATVKGDIHDIGKNIASTILETYGYQVLDLGRDVDPQVIVDTVLEQDIRLVGLSALMTTTLPAMEETVKRLKALDNPPKIMVGGAVVTPEYARSIGAEYYCEDAMADCAAAREVFAGDQDKG
ncbi:homocysteine S-methyltransferase family protein [Faecalibaculum rodentium]|uniref:Methionine synthase n=9 Tax=Faecalibaculum rodentium TaxID=1702221 RepID=A0A140DVX0_9FIRM|nr:homocysteine S-methyltransferase family protein [Faecalibaculum rodentium]AMK54797.1 methylmalonyl-CoA mutase domain-containing protein [Faecalibaculum rodentium]